MRCVVDANILAAALVRPDGWSARELTRTDVEWCVPAQAGEEIAEHEAEYLARARCTRAEWRARARALLARCTFVPADDLALQLDDVVVEITKRVDEADVPYTAALLASGAELLWTRDMALQDAFPGLAVLEVPRSAPSLTLDG